MNSLAIVGLKHLISDNQSTICMENREEVISRLKFIGFIQKDEKINVRHVNRQPNTIYTKISRSVLYPDNRNNALKFVRDVIQRSFEIIDSHCLQNNSLLARGIVADLIKAKQGISNLKYTYTDDTKFCCDIDVLIEQINTKISVAKESYPDILEEKSSSQN